MDCFTLAATPFRVAGAVFSHTRLYGLLIMVGGVGCVVVGRSYNIPGQNLLQVAFGIVGKVTLCRIIIQVAPLIPAWGKKLRTKIR